MIPNPWPTNLYLLGHWYWKYKFFSSSKFPWILHQAVSFVSSIKIWFPMTGFWFCSAREFPNTLYMLNLIRNQKDQNCSSYLQSQNKLNSTKKFHLQKVNGGQSWSQDSRKTMDLSGETYTVGSRQNCAWPYWL